MKKKAVFIINLKSGTSDKAAIPDIIAETIDRDKFDYEIAVTHNMLVTPPRLPQKQRTMAWILP